MNAAFLQARKLENFTCFVFHDVDMVPETDFALYRCRDSDQVGINITFNEYLHNEHLSQEMLHLAVSVSRWKYRLTYPSYLGGIVVIAPGTFLEIEGFSNKFWYWGGEDDDIYCRLTRHNVTIKR